jgi:hypothetical protein
MPILHWYANRIQEGMQGSSTPRSSAGGLSKEAIRQQLQRILAAETFCRSQRLAAFLRFVIEETRGPGVSAERANDRAVVVRRSPG